MRRLIASLLVLATSGLGAAAGCSSTEYPPEGRGRPSDRATGTVPAGSLGACRRADTKRPPLVAEKLWEETKVCNARTPATFVRLGYGVKDQEGEIDKLVDATLKAVKDAREIDKSNPDQAKGILLGVVRALKEYAPKDELLRRRVSKHSSLPYACDLFYLLENTNKERARLTDGNRCAAQVFHPEARAEVCLFDTTKDDLVWLTSSWDCTANSPAITEAQSCHRLCAYDDYCTRQAGCAAADMDLVLCAMGVCLPEARAGF